MSGHADSGAQPALRLFCPACNARYEAGQFCAKDGSPLAKDPTPAQVDLVGEVIADRYRIVRLIGEGGMGQVWEAQHVNINRRFAIKLLRPEIVSNPEAVARFRQEAWSASSIGHENIIEIDDFATLPSGAVYLAMEFLQGRSLAERLREAEPVTLPEALDLFLQVCRGLGAAHDKGIVHRDMKPENVFLAEKRGRRLVKILDFGIAKVSGIEGASSLTRTGSIFGTPHYMSPEQAMGNALDRRSDLYSVGVMMYELFTGHMPFEAESFMGILTKHITTVPKRPRELAPEREIPGELERVILRAMAKEPAERYGSTAELEAELEALAEAYAPELLHPAGTPTPRDQDHQEVGPPSGRRIGLWLSLLAAVCGFGTFAFVLHRTPDERGVALERASVLVAPAPAAHPPGPEMVTVIVDSFPPGARILHDGEDIGDTPEDVKVAVGTTLRVVLRKEGFLDETVVVDPARSRKPSWRLHRKESGPPAQRLPPPPYVPPAPARPPIFVRPAPPRTFGPPQLNRPAPRRPLDPYERLDDGPKRGGVLNPYN